MNNIEDFFDILKNLFKGNEIIYISTPINTGDKYIQWYKNHGKILKDNYKEYENEKKMMVIQPNIIRTKEFVKRLRKRVNKVVIDPTTFEIHNEDWSQDDFYDFWSSVIKELVNEIIFIDGWEYSIGCCYELLAAIKNNKKIYNEDMQQLTLKECIVKISNSFKAYFDNNLNEWKRVKNILDEIKKYITNTINQEIEMKDEKLDYLVNENIANIAQFISFSPNSYSKPRYVHIKNIENVINMDNEELIKKLILSAPSKKVNIRSFSKTKMKGNKLVFNKGIEDINEIIDTIKRNCSDNKYSIINENIDIKDCGVSGVVLGNVIEFSPEDTPKCVDKEGVCSLPREIGLNILKLVYGFSPNVNEFETNCRVEFSIHPKRQGVNSEHTIIWEYEYYDKADYNKKILWPNNFSRFIGDKVFGLLIADSLGISVPKTTVISRKVAPFSFGEETGLKEKWIRTCPVVKEPGKFYTGSEWIDPFKLIEKEDNSIDIKIASVLSQDSVESVYSGAAFILENDNDNIIEGIKGKGDSFMVGEQERQNLPIKVVDAVKKVISQIKMYYDQLGNVSIEWVYDGKKVWVVQLNQLKNNSITDNVIVEGEPLYYEEVLVKDGLDSLREKIKLIKGKNIGIELIGNVGVTSHFGDLLRIENIPSKLKYK